MSSSHDQTPSAYPQVPILPDHDGWYRPTEAESSALDANNQIDSSSRESRSVGSKDGTEDNLKMDKEDRSNEMEDIDEGDAERHNLMLLNVSPTPHPGHTDVFQWSKYSMNASFTLVSPASIIRISLAHSISLSHFAQSSTEQNATTPVLDIPVTPVSNEVCDQGGNQRKLEEDKNTTSLPLSDIHAILASNEASKEVCNQGENDVDQGNRAEDKPGLPAPHMNLLDLILLDRQGTKILFTIGSLSYLLFLIRALWKIGTMFLHQPLTGFGHSALSVGLLVFIQYNAPQIQGRDQRSGLLRLAIDMVIFIGAFICTSIMWSMICVIGDLASVALSVIRL
ncbi:uncharacterized protein C8R40DRAFT_1166020 [Lentinula edodes]|uniref:uncharacterized protein n=1 Tax=Lentinula edodes TaxID=5353 RepID=UPI001E8DFB52|nr:uncharacterized protein C8R40DRAFT_1166020 [Lentinula edodes]KAH7879782.1 hypothetical protein C8R40DRAFT_1166020 [Lentinula edodes]